MSTAWLWDENGFTWLADFSIKATVLFAVAAVITSLLRSNSAALRHRIWCLTFAGVCCVPLLTVIGPQWTLPIPSMATARDADPPLVASPETEPQTEQRNSPSSAFMQPPLPRHSYRNTHHEVDPRPATLTPTQPRQQPQVQNPSGDRAVNHSSSRRFSMTTAMLLVWMVGAMVSLRSLLASLFANRTRFRQAEKIQDAAWDRLVQQLSAELGIQRTVRLMRSNRNVVPMTWGLLRPIVMLPAGCLQWDSHRRRMVLLHELAHIKRFDLPIQLVAHIVAALQWFNPFVWYGVRRLNTECERACDDRVVNTGYSATQYAAELVGIAQSHQQLHAAAIVSMASKSQLEDRVVSLLDRRRCHASMTWAGTWGSLGVAGVLVLTAATVDPLQGSSNLNPHSNTDSAAFDSNRSNAAHPSFRQSESQQRSGRDALGDPLPQSALLRLGTQRFRHPSSVADLVLSPDERWLVTVGNEMIVWDATTGKEQWRVNLRSLGLSVPAACYGFRGVTFAPDGKRFYTAGGPETWIAWDTESGKKEEITLKRNDDRKKRPSRLANWSIDVTSSGDRMALGSPEKLVVCDMQREVKFEIESQTDALQSDVNNDRLVSGGPYCMGTFSPDGARLAVVTSDVPKEVKLYDAVSGDLLRTIELTGWLVRFDFSPDNVRLVTTERDNSIRMYDVESGEPVWSQTIKLTNPFENYTSAVKFRPDGQMIAAAATDNRIYLLDAASGEIIRSLSGHGWYPWALAFSSDSKRLFSSGWDGTIRRWNVESGEQLPLPAGVWANSAVAASPDGQTLAYGDDVGAIRVVNARDGSEQRILKLDGTSYSQMVFSPDGSLIAGGGTFGDQVHVAVWNLASGDLVHRWDWLKGRDPHSRVEELRFGPNGKRLAAAVFRQSAAYLWDLDSGEQIARVKHNTVYGLSFSPDGKSLATAGWDSQVRFWDTESGADQRSLNLNNIEEEIRTDRRMYTVCYAPSGGLIATAQLDGTVRVWSEDKLKQIAQFRVPGRFVYGAMSISPDGLWLATGSMSGKIALWDPLTGEQVWQQGRHQGYAYTVGFGRDSRTLVSGADDGVCYQWDLRPHDLDSDTDLERCWDDLCGEESQAAYRAMWQLAQTPDETVGLLVEKLQATRTVVDLDRAAPRSLDDEERKRREKIRQRVTQNKQAELLTTVRRAVALLAQLDQPNATEALQMLAREGNHPAIKEHATAALRRAGAEPPR